MDAIEGKIKRFQKSLPTLRKVAGWSAEDLANLLGVTRQTVVNLENGQTAMTRIQYIAIRALLEAEAKSSENKTLRGLIETLIDDDGISGKTRGKFKKVVDETVDRAASGVGRRAGSAAAGKAAVEELRPFLPLLSLSVFGLTAALASAPWLMDILERGQEKRRGRDAIRPPRRKAILSKEEHAMEYAGKNLAQYTEVYIVMDEDELVYADVDKESAEGYVEERAYEARAEILNEWGNDDPSEKDLAEAEFQMGYDGFNYSIERVDLSGLKAGDTVTTSDGTELDVSEIVSMLEGGDEDEDYDDEDDYDEDYDNEDYDDEDE